MGNTYFNFFDVIDNKNLITPVNLPRRVIVSYAILLVHLPLIEKKKSQYVKLDSDKKAGFLFKYLLKCAYLVNIPKPLITDLISTKEYYDTIQEKYKQDKLDDNTFLIEKIKKNSLSEMTDDIDSMIEKSIIIKSFEEKISLMVESIIYNASRENKRKKKLEEIFDINK
jgi:hypothetical protein